MNTRCITKVRKITQHRHTKRGNYDEWVSFVDEREVFADKNEEQSTEYREQRKGNLGKQLPHNPHLPHLPHLP